MIMVKSIFNDLACPICLGELRFLNSKKEDAKNGALLCTACKAKYSIKDGLPYFILSDKDWSKKENEIQGEMLFLYKELPPQTRIEYSKFETFRTKHILDNIKVDGLKVLNVGCQMGADSYLLATEYNCNVYSLDIEPATLVIANNILNKRQLTTPFICADGEWLPFKDETFDMVFCRQTLHHFPNIERGLEEIFRVTKMNGFIVIVDEPITGYFRQKVNKLMPGFLIKWAKNMLYGEHGNVVEDFERDEETGANLLSHGHIKSTLTLERVISILKNFTSDFKVSGSYGKLWLERNKENVIVSRYKSDSILERFLRMHMPTIFSESSNIIAKKTAKVNRKHRSDKVKPVNAKNIKFDIDVNREYESSRLIFRKVFDKISL